jgi:hypothetical protein
LHRLFSENLRQLVEPLLIRLRMWRRLHQKLRARQEHHGVQAALARLAVPEVAEEVAVVAVGACLAISIRVSITPPIATTMERGAPAVEAAPAEADTREVAVLTVPTAERQYGYYC